MKLCPNISFNNQTPNFQQAKKINRLITYQDLKLIPNLNCACCGRKVIEPTEFHNAFRTITLPLKSILQKGLLQPWKNSTPTWDFLVELSQMFPKKSLDQIEFNNSHVHGKLFETIRKSLETDPKSFQYNTPKQKQEKIKSLYYDIINRSRAQLRGSRKVMTRMKPFKKTLEKDPVKLAVFEQLEIYAEKYPHKTLSEILAIEEIHKFHSTKDLLQRAETREKLDYHFNNIAKLIKKESPDSIELIEKLKHDAVELLEQEKDPAARIPKMQKMYAQALTTIGCEKLIKKVNKELEQVPKSFITKDSFLAFAHRHRLSDYQIISSLLTPSVASSEHIIAVSKGGLDNLGNVSVFCRSCNKKRDAIPYTEFSEYHPEMIKNEQRQINQISRFILNNDVSEEAFYYPIDVAKTLSESTDGKINPDVSKYCEKRNQQINQHIQEQQNEIQKLREERQQMSEEKEAILKRLEEIEQTRREKKKQIKNIHEDISKDRYKSGKFQKYIDDKKTT